LSGKSECMALGPGWTSLWVRFMILKEVRTRNRYRHKFLVGKGGRTEQDESTSTPD
jgi:hypothetical protein